MPHDNRTVSCGPVIGHGAPGVHPGRRGRPLTADLKVDGYSRYVPCVRIGARRQRVEEMRQPRDLPADVTRGVGERTPVPAQRQKIGLRPAGDGVPRDTRSRPSRLARQRACGSARLRCTRVNSTCRSSGVQVCATSDSPGPPRASPAILRPVPPHGHAGAVGKHSSEHEGVARRALHGAQQRSQSARRLSGVE